MRNKYKIGFWNYVNTGDRDEKDVMMWRELGFNLAMSFEFDPAVHDKSAMIRVLDECLEQNISVIVCDSRTNFRTCLAVGKDAFVKGVHAAVEDFGTHKAVYGFHIGDEPLDNVPAEVEAAAFALKTVKNVAPWLHPFLNLLPIHDELSCGPKEYCSFWFDVFKDSGANIVSYDYYGQCSYFEREKYRDIYFRNLNEWYATASKMNAECWTCLLSVGHGSLRVPTQDDIRWQINTAAAHGLTGFLWFFLYERFYDGWWAFRNSPIDRFWNKTDLYDKLAYENKTFLEFHAPVLSQYQFVKVMHFNKCYGGTDEFKTGHGIKSLSIWINEGCPLIVSEFENEVSRAFVVVNNSQTEPVRIKLEFDDDLKMPMQSPWLAPGGMQIFTLNK